jgi:hypothetical protein
VPNQLYSWWQAGKVIRDAWIGRRIIDDDNVVRGVYRGVENAFDGPLRFRKAAKTRDDDIDRRCRRAGQANHHEILSAAVRVNDFVIACKRRMFSNARCNAARPTARADHPIAHAWSQTAALLSLPDR